MLVNYWDKYTETHGQQNVQICIYCYTNKYTYNKCKIVLQLLQLVAFVITYAATFYQWSDCTITTYFCI